MKAGKEQFRDVRILRGIKHKSTWFTISLLAPGYPVTLKAETIGTQRQSL